MPTASASPRTGMGHSGFDLGRRSMSEREPGQWSRWPWGQAQTLMGVLEQRKTKPSLQFKSVSQGDADRFSRSAARLKRCSSRDSDECLEISAIEFRTHFVRYCA